MATKELEKTDTNAEILETVALDGDLSKLSPENRLKYYLATCESLGLNHLTKPFQYLKLQGKLTLYATKDCSEQLTRKHLVSLEKRGVEDFKDIRIITYRASDPEGRYVDATGAVPIGNLNGESLANALMKAETKASRRATLRLVGLGWLDETEIDTIRDVKLVEVDEHGEIQSETAISPPPAESKPRRTRKPRSASASAPEKQQHGVDMHCEYHDADWFQTKIGYGHPIKDENGDTLQNEQGYDRWCRQPHAGMDSKGFWIARQNLDWSEEFVQELLGCTIEEYQNLHDQEDFFKIHQDCLTKVLEGRNEEEEEEENTDIVW
jgi:hypothetical protein